MPRKSNIRVNSLDFDGIKSNLKDFLRSQGTFSDYNFEGSAMSILLDLLAYNTHYMGFYNNMVANEMFMDSAVKRGSVVSLAKHLGYQPGSATSARAVVDLSLTSPAADSVIPKGSKFIATLDGVNYQFINLQTATVDIGADLANPSAFHITGLVIHEGAITSQTFVYDNSDPEQKFILPQKNIDKTTIKVRRQESSSDSTGYSDLWSEATDVTVIDPSSKIYNIVEMGDGKLEIRFGDDVLGEKLTHGNLITVEYLITTGPSANVIGASDSSTNRVFSSSVGFINDIRVTSEAQGGSLRESMDSIRFNAPMFFASQNRAVTAADYKSILQKEFPSISSLNVYGGELANPPEYGRVLVVVKPNTGTEITDNTKIEIENRILESKGVVAINAKVISPTYVYLKIKSSVETDTDVTSLTTDEVKTMVKDRIITWSTDNLERFERGLRYSKLAKLIDDTDQGILGSQTNVTLEYRLKPNLNVSTTYAFSISNAIHHPHDGHKTVIRSSEFTYLDDSNLVKTGIIEDDGYSNLLLKRKNVHGLFEKDKIIGSINYSKSLIYVDRLKILTPGTLYSDIRFQIIAASLDIISMNDVILILDENDPTSLDISVYASPGGRFVGTSSGEAETQTKTSTTGDITPDFSNIVGGGISSYDG
jgi:hypothetical protein